MKVSKEEILEAVNGNGPEQKKTFGTISYGSRKGEQYETSCNESDITTEAGTEMAWENGWSLKNLETQGGEGEGDEFRVILEFRVNGEVESHWRIDGWYASHHGAEAEIEEMYECERSTKMVEAVYWNQV